MTRAPKMANMECECPDCGLCYVREVKNWQVDGYKLIYRVKDGKVLYPCDTCAEKKKQAS